MFNKPFTWCNFCEKIIGQKHCSCLFGKIKCTEVFTDPVTITGSSIHSTSSYFTKVFTVSATVTGSSVLSTSSYSTKWGLFGDYRYSNCSMDCCMASSTEIVRYLHQISRQQQKFMEQLDTLIGVLSGPPERPLEAVDKTPVTPSVDQNQIPSVDSQTPVPSELPAMEHEQIFSLRQTAVSNKELCCFLNAPFYSAPWAYRKECPKKWETALHPRWTDTVKDLVFHFHPTAQGEWEIAWRNCHVAWTLSSVAKNLSMHSSFLLAAHLIGWDKKSETVQYFQGTLCNKIGPLCDKWFCDFFGAN